MHHGGTHIICPVPQSPKSRTRIWIPICLVPEPVLDQAAHTYQGNTVYPHAIHCSIIWCGQLEHRKVHNKVLIMWSTENSCWNEQAGVSGVWVGGWSWPWAWKDMLDIMVETCYLPNLLVGLSFNCKHQTWGGNNRKIFLDPECTSETIGHKLQGTVTREKHSLIYW